MDRKTRIKIMAVLLILTFLAGLMPELDIFADTMLLQPPSQNRVTDIGYVKNAYGVSEWYADLEWNWDITDFPAEADERYIIVGMNEISTGSGTVVPDAITIPLNGAATSYHFTAYNPEGIKHGTIYETYLKSQYKINTPTGQYTITSQKSNPAKFLTGLHVSVELLPGTNHMKIKWDDVWNTTGRINYRILISDTKGFTQPPPVPDIIASEIGKPGSNVTINSTEKKLEYVYTHALPGREYSIKVVPLPDASVAYATAEEIEPVTIKTDILLKAQKVGYNNEGDTIWKLFWNPIVKGSTFTRVDYELYRYVNNDPEGKLYRLIPDIDNYQITVKKGDTNTYSFRIDAKAYVPGSPIPVDFRSNNKVALKEQIPQRPQAPEIVDSFPPADSDLKYDDFLTPFSASIFWKPPKTGEGLIDSDVTYDIYLVEDVQDVKNPPSNYRIASNYTISEADMIRSDATGEIVGYRFDLTGLKSNSTYYFVIYAKKSYLVESPDEGFMITMPYLSKQSVKVIITDPDAGSDKPIAPAAPPFGLKINADGSDSVTLTGATLVLDKKWYAFYNKLDERWEQVSRDEYIENELLDPDDESKEIGTVVNYLPGWLVVPHVVKFNEALEAIRLRNDRDEPYITYSDLFQPDIIAFEIPQQSFNVPDLEDNEDQTFSFNISGLDDNTTYLVWVTIENQNGVSSYPSDPIIITTPVDMPDKPVTPTVPDDLKGIAASSFVDLFWTYFTGMDYVIRGGTSDKLEQATITRQVSYEEIKTNTFFRVDSLKPDTVYYFWIKAVSTSEQGQIIESEYSNPLVIKTEAHKPPAPPTGFGPDGVTESSITYSWIRLDGLSYILEFSDDLSFTGSRLIEVSGDTYTAAGLIANRRYYARLYAFDSKTKLRSQPTRTIMVITNKSKSEYDGSFDLEEAVAGDGLDIPAKLENGVWVISSLGDDAHVLGERIRNQYGSIVKIDLSVPPVRTSNIRIELSSIVLDTLSDLKKELYLIMPWGEYTIRPSTFNTDEYFRMKTINSELDFRLETLAPASQYQPSATMQIKTPVTDFKFSYIQGGQISMLNLPIRVELPVADITNYAQGQIKTFAYNSARGWYKLPTFTDYSLGRVIGEMDKPSAIVAATEGLKPDT
ncbi:MAG: fibronectin type III domain-containing protein, partial [Acetivibrionales bacterium]